MEPILAKHAKRRTPRERMFPSILLRYFFCSYRYFGDVSVKDLELKTSNIYMGFHFYFYNEGQDGCCLPYKDNVSSSI